MPPAPGRLKTCTVPVMPSFSMTCAAARAVVSYPPPGAFGTMYWRPVAGAALPAADDAPSDPWSLVAPQPVRARVATTTAPRAMRWSLIVEITFVERRANVMIVRGPKGYCRASVSREG